MRQVLIRWLFGLALCCGAAAAPAALPDPITFGLAVERGDQRLVSRWLDEGLAPDFVADRIGTGLMIAAWNGDIAMMELFLSRGADLARANRNGEQALQLAAWNGHLPAVDWLLKRGAVLNRPDRQWGALHYAVFGGHGDLARALIDVGASVNARSPNGTTPLMLAAREGSEEIAAMLLLAGADAHLKSDWGDSALTFAMRYEHFRIGKMVATAEEFAAAVKAPASDFGQAARSLAAPSKINQALQRIREASAKGADTAALRSELHAAITEFRGPPKPLAQIGPKVIRPTPPPRALMITARRAGQGGGERVEMVGADAAAAVASPSRIADLVRRIRVAEAQGLSSAALRRELDAALQKLN